jgi:[acyl-carrier-protein] S-malonyltransferase
MRTVAILCSGQGGQGRGMFDLVADAPEASDVFATAAAVLGGRDPRDIAATGSDDVLHANATGQILCCTQAMAVWAVLQPKLGEGHLVVAGYSVGEVAAWGVAGALEPGTVFDVTARRAAWMDAATDGPAGLLAIRGLGPGAIAKLCREEQVHVAIRTAPERVVIGGRRAALDRAGEVAKRRGAAGLTPIPVEVPSHTPLLQEAAAHLGDFLRGLDGVREPQARLLSGIDGTAVFDVADGLDKLARQVAQTVDWAACMESCRAAGATRALELGPGDALARMMGGVLSESESRSVAEFRSIHGVVDWFRS